MLPDQQAFSPSLRVGRANFRQYRESQIGSPSVSSRPSSRSLHSGHHLSSSTSSSQPQASFGPLYSDQRHTISSAQDTPESLRQQRLAVRASHIVTDSWYHLYETLELGTIPSPEQCACAPPSQQLLAKIPHQKSFHKGSALGHFFTSPNNTEFQCQVKNDTGVPCGKLFKKTGGSKTRLNHVISFHPELYDALKEFQEYQSKVQGIKLPPEPDDLDVPSTPKRSKFETVHDEFIISNMKQPLAYEEETFIDLILKLITQRGIPFATIGSGEFKALCGLLNPLYTIPSRETLQRWLDSRVRSQHHDIQAYIHKNVVCGSITADSWTAVDGRKFLGITFHFLSPTFQLASVVIGMERIKGPQTSDTLLKSICKIFVLINYLTWTKKYFSDHFFTLLF